MQRLLFELQRRKVLRVASAYIVGAWIVLQVALALQTAMKLPDGFATVVLSLSIIGLPIALILAWLFEFTPEGIKRTVPASGDGALVKPQTTDLILAGALGLVVVVALVQLLMPGADTTSAPSTTTAAENPKPALPALGDKSIAVLPFANLSPDREDAFFADGLTEEILNALAQVRGLRVVSRTSSFAFKDKNVPLKEVARALSVRYALEGSVRREGDDVRVTAQLIDVPEDGHIWSKTFERKLDNVFVVQNDIAGAIALALEAEVRIPAGPRAAPTKSLEAYRLYVKGQEMNRRGEAGDVTESIDFYRRAIALDANFAEAHAGLAGVYLFIPIVEPARVKEVLPLARASAEAALKLNPNLPNSYHILGSLDSHQLRWEQAATRLRKAIDVDPSYSYALVALGIMHQRLGYLKEGDRLLREARSVDPLNNQIGAPLAFSALARADDRWLEPVARKTTASHNEFAFFGHWILACLAHEKGDHAEADLQFRAFMAKRGVNNAIVEPVSRALKSPAAAAAAVRALEQEAARDPSFQPENVLYLVDRQGAWIDALNARLTRNETYFVSFWLPGVWRAVAQTGGASAQTKQLMRNAGLVDYWKKHGWPDRCRAKGEDDFECS